jgi:hypothetical protein
MTATIHDSKDDRLTKMERAFRLQVGLLMKAQQDMSAMITAADVGICDLKARIVKLERGL